MTQMDMANVMQQDPNLMPQPVQQRSVMKGEGSTKNKSKSLNKFSQPDLQRYNHSIERLSNL